ncbi:MAG: MBL fold metallo-hydrolase [Oscillospiraceae bacterium]|nr:MBL fold metallo-hydrolase [Oscillospiraceae bacterium]
MRKRLFAITLTLLLLLSGCEGLLEPQPEFVGGSGLTVEFIDVGQADSILVTCEDATMLIDGGNAADSDLIYTYLKDRGITRLDYVIATHAHEDHIGGLPGALEYAEAGTALCPVTDYDSKVFDNFVRALDEQGVSITVPEPGERFPLGGAEAEIVGPINPSDDPNGTSVVLRLTYGKTSFLFAGDAERGEEQDILGAGYNLSADVLKVGHHGSDTSTSYPFLREVMPRYAVISCGTDNSYGHPHDGLLSRLRDADVTLYRTDMQGSVTCVSDGETVSFTVERNAGAQTNPAQPSVAEDHYIANINSRVFHRPSCSGLPAEKNRVTFGTREEAAGEGYTPCGICKP